MCRAEKLLRKQRQRRPAKAPRTRGISGWASCPGAQRVEGPNGGFAPFLPAQDILAHENLSRELENELKLRRQSAISPVKVGARRLSASEPDHDGRNPS